MGQAVIAPLLIASTAISAGTMIMSGVQAKQQADAEAQVAKNNAKIANYERGAEEIRKEEEIQNIRLRQAKIQAAGETGFAAGNIQLGEGTPLTWSMDVAEAAEADVRTAKYNSDMRDWALRQQAANATNQASIYSRAGDNALTTSVLNSIGTVASGATDYALYKSGYFRSSTSKKGI